MESGELLGIERFDVFMRDVSKVMIFFFDDSLDNVIEQLDKLKTVFTLVQQELVDIGNGDISFSKKYFDIA